MRGVHVVQLVELLPKQVLKLCFVDVQWALKYGNERCVFILRGDFRLNEMTKIAAKPRGGCLRSQLAINGETYGFIIESGLGADAGKRGPLNKVSKCAIRFE